MPTSTWRGTKAGTILDHELHVAADQYTPGDATLIPTGEIKPVKGTPLDFTKSDSHRRPHRPGQGRPERLRSQFRAANGGKSLALAARVHEPKTGRVMEMLTTEPGVQFYTGNFLDGKIKGKGGVVYPSTRRFAWKPSTSPIRSTSAKFPSIILTPGKTYQQTTIYKFSAK